MTTQLTDVAEKEALNAMILERTKDKYKIAYAALRWAKEIKQKENLPDPIPKLLPRALREILTGKVSFETVEELPVMVKVAAPPAPTATPAPTLTVKTEEDISEEKPVEEKAPVADEVKEAVKVEAAPEDSAAEESTETAEEDVKEAEEEAEEPKEG